MILRHRNQSVGYFNESLLSTGLENINDPDANTYSIIGGIDPNDYIFDEGVYWFILSYGYHDGSNITIKWKQTSWITNSTITGVDLYDVPSQAGMSAGAEFRGLGRPTISNAYLDGDGDYTLMSWNAVGSLDPYNTGKSVFCLSATCLEMLNDVFFGTVFCLSESLKKHF